jgi:hypothetical protein
VARIAAGAENDYLDAELCGHWTLPMAYDDVPGEDWPREARLLQPQAEYDDIHPWVDGGEHAVCLDTPTTTKEA